MTRVIVPSGAVLYQRPGSVKIAVLSQGREYAVLQETDDWVKIADQTWVARVLCTFINQPPPASIIKPVVTLTSDTDVRPPSPPAPTATLVYVLHDDVPRGPGLPESNKCLSDRFFPVTKKMWDQIVAVNRLLHPNMPDKDFDRNMNSLFGPHLYITNRHAIGTESFAIENLYTGGATFRAVTGQPFKKNGKMWMEVYCIDPKNLPPTPASLDQIDLLQGWSFPCTAPSKGIANPFPQFQGRVLLPLYGKGGRNAILAENKDRKDGLGVLRVDHIIQPHVPPRPDITAGVVP